MTRIKVFVSVAALVATAALLMGCSTNVSQEPTDNGIYVENSGGGGSVTVLDVPDGDGTVKCAVLIGYSKGGISCDWADASNNE